jgi:hypothetical protein
MCADESMSDEQAATLKALAETALEPEAFNPRLDSTEAARRIKALKAKLRLMDGPPHSL